MNFSGYFGTHVFIRTDANQNRKRKERRKQFKKKDNVSFKILKYHAR